MPGTKLFFYTFRKIKVMKAAFLYGCSPVRMETNNWTPIASNYVP